MGEVIVVTSGKGGVGKTTTTANIGAGLSRLDKKVVIIDTDLGLRNLDVVMGLENLIVYNLVDVIEGKCRMKQALIRDRRYENLYLLPSAQTKDKSAVSPGQIRKLTDELKEEFDYILEGDLKVQLEDHCEILHAGDAIYYNSGHGHGMIATGGKECRFIAVVLKEEEE